jgi:hypothetical protein
MTGKPRYQHDCEHCSFLGPWREFDLYHCAGQRTYTLIARKSSEPADYASGAECEGTIPAIAVAGERARRAGLIARMPA